MTSGVRSAMTGTRAASEIEAGKGAIVTIGRNPADIGRRKHLGRVVVLAQKANERRDTERRGVHARVVGILGATNEHQPKRRMTFGQECECAHRRGDAGSRVLIDDAHHELRRVGEAEHGARRGACVLHFGDVDTQWCDEAALTVARARAIRLRAEEEHRRGDLAGEHSRLTDVGDAARWNAANHRAAFGEPHRGAGDELFAFRVEEHDLDELFLEDSAQAPGVGPDGIGRRHCDDLQPFLEKARCWPAAFATDDGDLRALCDKSARRHGKGARRPAPVRFAV